MAGTASGVVSIVHIVNGTWDHKRLLNGHPVETITAYLFHAGSNEDPTQLAANADKSSWRHVLGMGFTFDDTDTKGVATSLAEMRRLIEKDPRNDEVSSRTSAAKR